MKYSIKKASDKPIDELDLPKIPLSDYKNRKYYEERYSEYNLYYVEIDTLEDLVKLQEVFKEALVINLNIKPEIGSKRTHITVYDYWLE